MAHILTLAIERVGNLKIPNRFLSGEYNSQNENILFFNKEILPFLTNIILFRAPFAAPLEELEKTLDDADKQSIFWGGLVTRNFQQAEVLLAKDSEAQTCIESFTEKLLQAVKDEVEPEQINAIFAGFMGELIRCQNGMSATIIHNFLYLAKKMGSQRENDPHSITLNSYIFICNCLLNGLKMKEKLNASQESSIRSIIFILMDSPLFNLPYKRESYENKEYPEKPSLLTRLKQLKLSGKKKDPEAKKYATVESLLGSSSPKQLGNTTCKDNAFPSPSLVRERSLSVAVKPKEVSVVTTAKPKFDPNQFGGFSYVMPLSLPAYQHQSTKNNENKEADTQEHVVVEKKSKKKL